ncbi:MAG: hypothetical protein JKZ00_07240 [Flavobacteriaceae bacterium]|nr:hypothetical protein [Flavobacteriaceae bacterium]
MINKKDYPLVHIRNLDSFYPKIRKIIDENLEVLKVEKDENLTIILSDNDSNSKFKFKITSPRFIDNKTYYSIEFNPSNATTLNGYKNERIEGASIFTHLENWIKLINIYNSISLSEEDKILREYENEFYNGFKILDEDADIKPYNLKVQIIIQNFMTNSIELLSKNENDSSDLIEEATILKESIPKLTKQQTAQNLSRFLAKVRIQSLSLLKEILELGKKELFKRFITGGFDFITDMIHLM